MGQKEKKTKALELKTVYCDFMTKICRGSGENVHARLLALVASKNGQTRSTFSRLL